LKPRLAYLASSAIAKRCMEEAGGRADPILFRGTSSACGDYAAARTLFIGETVRLLKLRLLLLVPVHARLLASAWELVEKHHIY